MLPFSGSRREKRRRKKLKINFNNGRLEAPNINKWQTHWREPYYLMLTVPWWGFFLLSAIAYLTINSIFAAAYLLAGDCIAAAKSGSFIDAFFFSVQTIASIGYGVMNPTCLYSNILVTIEALLGTVGMALMTGLAFAKFSQPTAKVMFSKVAVITNYDGVPTLMFRAANQRYNQILEAQAQVYLMRDEINSEGEFMRRFHLLKLIGDRTPRLTLSWTIMHAVDETSPLWQATSESLVSSRATLVVSLNGIDETVYHSLHAPYSYGANDIFFNHRFVDIFEQTPEGHRYLNLDYFDEVESLS